HGRLGQPVDEHHASGAHPMRRTPKFAAARRRAPVGLARDARGAAAVEFALVLPLLLIFVFGIWWMGWAINLGGEVRHAVEMGSRIYILHPSATATELQTAVASHLTAVDVSDISLATASTTVGTATSQHI